ncbi:putative peptidase M43, pregnancy-associated plasma-A [Septoria linicola]|nr:putative peptidase M43, pregnancy-associated plasma-A [Septoria linicola]
MKFTGITTAVSLFASLAIAQEEPPRCAMPTSGPGLAAVLEGASQPPPLDPNAPARISSGINVETYVHLVTTDASIDLFPPSMVDEQIRVMNDRFGPSGFNFNVLNVTRTVNNAWGRGMRAQSAAERAMKAAPNQGGYDSLNLYFVSQTVQNILGWCYFPQGQPTAAQRTIDGCVNLASSMPKGGTNNYQMGLTAVHEIGHWLGLFHVFSGTCDGPGDFVDDTNHQRNATSGCPAVAPDTCTLRPGLDNIKNYMDYSFDVCMTEFTRGQDERATNIFTALRAGNVRFSEPESLGDGAINAPRRNCADESTYMASDLGQGRTSMSTDALSIVEQPGQLIVPLHVSLMLMLGSRYNARHGLPGTCRYFNTYQQTRACVVESQQCAMYTQRWGAELATNRGQWQNRGQTWVGIQNSVGVFDLDNDGVPTDCS